MSIIRDQINTSHLLESQSPHDVKVVCYARINIGLDTENKVRALVKNTAKTYFHKK